jgi:hypothetical protein
MPRDERAGQYYAVFDVPTDDHKQLMDAWLEKSLIVF